MSTSGYVLGTRTYHDWFVPVTGIIIAGKPMLRENALLVGRRLLAGGDTEVQVQLCPFLPLSLTSGILGRKRITRGIYSALCA